MKKYISFLFVFVFLFGLFYFVSPKKVEAVSCSAFSMTLKMGMNNSEVKCLQEMLNNSGFPVSSIGAGAQGLETSYFGVKTSSALKAFQSANSLTVDGIFGPLSRSKITSIGPVSYPVLGCTANSIFSSTTGIPCNNSSSLIVSAPVASVVWVAGSTYKINWTLNPLMGPLPSKVTITLNAPRPACLDSVPACQIAEMVPYTIASNITDTGSYNWTIPLSISENYLGSMQITITRDFPQAVGRSAIFSILGPSLMEFNSPSNNNQWETGQSYDVSWSNSNLLSTSTVELGLVNLNYISTTTVVPLDNALNVDSAIVWRSNIPNVSPYKFTVPEDLKSGTYRFYLKNINEYAVSDDFVIISGNSICTDCNAPVITGISGPQELNIGEQGSWTVTAYNPNGGILSYSVNWTDPYFDTNYITASSIQQQTGIFTHTYSREGTYAPMFTVTNSAGTSAQVSLSVKVTDTTDDCVTNTGFSPSTGKPCSL